jgi:hypothetical protein
LIADAETVSAPRPDRRRIERVCGCVYGVDPKLGGHQWPRTVLPPLRADGKRWTAACYRSIDRLTFRYVLLFLSASGIEERGWHRIRCCSFWCHLASSRLSSCRQASDFGDDFDGPASLRVSGCRRRRPYASSSFCVSGVAWGRVPSISLHGLARVEPHLVTYQPQCHGPRP